MDKRSIEVQKMYFNCIFLCLPFLRLSSRYLGIVNAFE